MTDVKRTAAAYEPSENILHLWLPERVELIDEEAMQVFFDEVVDDWLKPCPARPYLLVNFGNLHIRPDLAEAYASHIGRFQAMLLGTFRYGIPASFTGVAVALGNLRLAAPAHMFADERCAREAIHRAKELASGRGSGR